MAGNPFRRSMAVVPPADVQPSLSTTVDASTTPHKRTKTKRVKIESPPLATQNHGGRRLSASDSATRAPSPPPPDRSDEDDDETAASDSTATADSDLDQATLNARRNSGSLPDPATSMAGGMKAPYNPFARTLATKEASFGLQQNHEQLDQQRPRPAMDVEAFKNILLTGSATPQASSTFGAAETPASALRRPHDSGSSTETSSIFDSAYTLHPESPRVDHYDFHSTSDSDDDENDDDQNENERTNLMGQGRLDDLPPPAPPKPKSTRGPQTVSFADFDQSIPPNFQAPGGRGTPPLNTQHRGILRPTMQRSVSDLNKPLPPPPAVQQTSDALSPPTVPEKDVPQSQQHPTESTLMPSDDALSIPKKVPPPPPASRRQAAPPGRPRSASNLSAQESISDMPGSQDPSNVPPPVKADEPTSSKQSHPPPPPPARKVHPVAPSQATTDLPVHTPLEPKPSIPTPPPRRHPSTSASNRTVSPASSLRKEISTFPSAGTNAPPPPPPRRAAGGVNSSQRSSIDGRPSSLRKFSGMETQRRASKQSVDSAGSEQAASSPSAEAAKRDVLADMKSFQAEIDALRLQAGDGK